MTHWMFAKKVEMFYKLGRSLSFMIVVKWLSKSHRPMHKLCVVMYALSCIHLIDMSNKTAAIGWNTHLHETQRPRRNRQRNVIWFNPAFSKNVKTNIARNFLHLVDTHFPAGHKLHKIFNRNTVKVSYRQCFHFEGNFLLKENFEKVKEN